VGNVGDWLENELVDHQATADPPIGVVLKDRVNSAELWLVTVNCLLPSILRPEFLRKTLLYFAMVRHWRYHAVNVRAAEILLVSRVSSRRRCVSAKGLMSFSSQILWTRLLVDCYQNYCVSCSALGGLLLKFGLSYWNGCSDAHGHRQDVLTPIWTAYSGSFHTMAPCHEDCGHGQQHGSCAACARTLCAMLRSETLAKEIAQTKSDQPIAADLQVKGNRDKACLPEKE